MKSIFQILRTNLEREYFEACESFDSFKLTTTTSGSALIAFQPKNKKKKERKKEGLSSELNLVHVNEDCHLTKRQPLYIYLFYDGCSASVIVSPLPVLQNYPMFLKAVLNVVSAQG